MPALSERGKVNLLPTCIVRLPPFLYVSLLIMESSPSRSTYSRSHSTFCIGREHSRFGLIILKPLEHDMVCALELLEGQGGG